VRYDSEEALELGRRLGHAIREAAWDASTELAEKRGCFPNWEGSTWDVQHGRKMRNAHCVTIAPTGTISIIAGCSGGIEPIFSLAFTRQVLDGKTLHEVNPIFRETLGESCGSEAEIEEVIQHVAERGSIQEVPQLPDAVKEIYRTSRDIDASWHVRMQAAWQESTDAAVSKTINLDADAKPSDVEQAYRMAYSLRCKGITVYRDGSRPTQPMALKGQEGKTKEQIQKERETGSAGSNDKAANDKAANDKAANDRVANDRVANDRAANDKAANDKAPEPTVAATSPATPISLPELMPCVRVRQLTPFGNMHVKISVEPGTGIEREVFAQLGKGGDLATSDLEAICRILSLFLRCNGELKRAVGQLEGIGSSLSVPSRDGRIMSLADGLAHALCKYMRAKKAVGLRALLLGEFGQDLFAEPEPSPSPVLSRNGTGQADLFKVKCPECGGTLAHSEGCVKCHGCGYSQC